MDELVEYTATIATITNLFGTLPLNVQKVVGGWIFESAQSKPIPAHLSTTTKLPRRYNRKSKTLGRAINVPRG